MGTFKLNIPVFGEHRGGLTNLEAERKNFNFD